MDDLLGAAITAFWFGVLTSISPCPLASNIAAISYVGRRAGNARSVLWSGLLYTLGRAIAYTALGSLLVSSMLSAFAVSRALQKYMLVGLGPLLIVVGIIVLGVVRLPIGGTNFTERLQKRVDAMGLGGALLLGIIFALSFCPVSAALFFGSLLPLALQYESGFLLPASYGIATALPVIASTIVVASGAAAMKNFFSHMQRFDLWSRIVTGIIIIAIGVYFVAKYIFGLTI